jgi:hypothetical protein
MKTDLYTKTMLTIIAGALLYLCVAKNPPSVRADSAQKVQEAAPQKVIIVGEELRNSLPVRLLAVEETGGLFPVGHKHPLPVEVQH